MAPGPSNLRSHDEMLAVLLDAGFSAAMATHASNLIDSYVLGFALQETSFPFSNAEELAAVGDELLAQVPVDEYPSFRARWGGAPRVRIRLRRRVRVRARPHPRGYRAALQRA